MSSRPNADAGELARFGALASSWWDPQGPSRPLHELNPHRLRYIERSVALKGSRVLDVGCGGGVLSESLARAGARVLGIDLAPELIQVAELHALEAKLPLEYRRVSAEALATEQPGGFDVITCMELLEHVPDPPATLAALGTLVRPGGAIFLSTLNRTPAAFLVAIVGAEHVARILPRGTHEYLKFIRPSELARWARACSLELEDLTGLSYHPLTRSFALSSDTRVNYLARLRRPELA
ncbi:MAG TPA: bifunctional 2-polyprenyl-6-hydroxyphenol methylase/3-demethylubiquinol 3-O-methyltransferase UbiG [Steroidobacteraceae bacterium]|nr:bifunctional 2-polyprenyl-6-hydroxyphenol methylase/3-demethylubiquinol 3-O-methyltransferase UbiG [Steroidobacteraceae bacterium]